MHMHCATVGEAYLRSTHNLLENINVCHFGRLSCTLRFVNEMLLIMTVTAPQI